MNDDILPQGERAGISEHCAEQLHAFFVGGHHLARRYAVASRKDCVHPAIRRVPDISVRRFTELIVPLTVGQAFANVGAQPPCSEHWTIGRRLARLYRW